jgi:hypothetical protein
MRIRIPNTRSTNACAFAVHRPHSPQDSTAAIDFQASFCQHLKKRTKRVNESAVSALISKSQPAVSALK